MGLLFIRLRRGSIWLLWLLMVGLAGLLFYTSIFYFSFRTDINFLLAKREYVHDMLWMSAFYIHIAGSMVCVISGPFQFIDAFRIKFPAFHRQLGKAYVGAILFVGGPSGLYMSAFANGGLGTKVGFFILSFLWLRSTYLAYKRIRQKNVASHQAWMIRSYALTFSAVTLRLYVWVLSSYFFIDHDLIVLLTAWFNWIPNLIAAECILFFSKNKTKDTILSLFFVSNRQSIIHHK
ncbi:MAG: DUF2306 domain-containing protein [Microscillaceae bacterium]|nr:DUF2306 domain-containing protein [Microscillaceae bacterium]